MMGEIASLVVPPTAREEQQRKVVVLLEDLLKIAKEGKVEAVAGVLIHIDGDYEEFASASLAFTQMVGAIDIVKARLIANKFKEEKEEA